MLSAPTPRTGWKPPYVPGKLLEGTAYPCVPSGGEGFGCGPAPLIRCDAASSLERDVLAEMTGRPFPIGGRCYWRAKDIVVEDTAQLATRFLRSTPRWNSSRPGPKMLLVPICRLWRRHGFIKLDVPRNQTRSTQLPQSRCGRAGRGGVEKEGSCKKNFPNRPDVLE